MSRTTHLLERLREVNPVPAPEEPFAPKSRARGSRRRLVFAGAAVAAIAVLMLAFVALNPGEDSDGVIAAAAATAADQAPIEIAPDQFAYRTEQWSQPSIPGVVASATPERLDVAQADQSLPPRTGTREVWFSPRNRGRVEGDKGESWPPCSAADYVVGYITNELCWSAIGGPAGFPYSFEESPEIQRIISRRSNEEPPPYWEFSPDIAKLGTDPAKIDAAVTDLGKQMEDNRDILLTLGKEGTAISFKPTEFNDAAFKLRAVGDLLANPLAPPDVRAALFRYAGSIDGVETTDDATDPQGRSGAAISITSTPTDPEPVIVSGLPHTISEPFNQYTEHGYAIDLSGLTLRTEIIFDPDTSELLSESTQLVSADDPLLGPWLAREGAPQTLYSRTFNPVTVVGSIGERPASG